MYSDGFVAAVILGLLALLSPVLWIGWWLLADLGERGFRHVSHQAPWERRAGTPPGSWRPC